MEKLMEKFRGGVIAIAIASIAIVACVCMFSTSANAEDNVDPTPLASAKITQQVEAADNATFTAEFKYTFTKAVDSNPTISDKSLSLAATAGVGQGESPNDTKKSVIEGINDIYYKELTFDKILDGVTYDNAGEFKYTISKERGAVTPDDATWSDVDTCATYTLRVYVKNGTSGTEIQGITLEPIPVAEKTDNIIYKSKLVTKSDLTIKKFVGGDHGDKTHPFQFTITLYDSDKTSGSVIATKSGSTPSTVTFNFTNGVAEASTTLVDGQTLTFTGDNALTTGTTYKVVEKGKADDPVIELYTTTAKTTTVNTNGSVVVDTPAGDAGSGITVQYGTGSGQNNAAIVGQDPGNETDVTNNLTLTPTGFLIDAAPYILMIGIPIIALIIWIVVRKRRAARQF